jgi:hypothetical protein
MNGFEIVAGASHPNPQRDGVSIRTVGSSLRGAANGRRTCSLGKNTLVTCYWLLIGSRRFLSSPPRPAFVSTWHEALPYSRTRFAGLVRHGLAACTEQ